MSSNSKMLAAFSEDHVERLTGVTKPQLRYWDRTRLYQPRFAEKNRRVPFSRVYSFHDIIALRVLHVLRNQFGVSLQHLREVSERLSHLGPTRWTGYRLYVLNKKVIWHEPGSQKPQEIASQQFLVPLSLDEVISDTKCDVVGLNRRNDAEIGKVVRSRYVNHNAPVLAGTRIPVSAVKNFARAGYSTDQIINEYPDLTEKDVAAALAYKETKAAA